MSETDQKYVSSTVTHSTSDGTVVYNLDTPEQSKLFSEATVTNLHAYHFPIIIGACLLLILFVLCVTFGICHFTRFFISPTTFRYLFSAWVFALFAWLVFSYSLQEKNRRLQQRVEDEISHTTSANS